VTAKKSMGAAAKVEEQQTPDTPPPAEVAATTNPLDGLKPGRIVYYNPKQHETRFASPGPWPAMVTAVSKESPGVVTLNVNLPEPAQVSSGGDPVARFRDVPFSADGAEGCWCWMFEGQNTRYNPDRKS